jgi:3-methyladenine DNA glycosylase/8-oxoguanine DNA glycosylase
VAKLGARAARDLTAAVHQILNLDEDLSEFYALVATTRSLVSAPGASCSAPTVFEAVVKTT